jgi:hypothetical protein
MVLTNNRFDIVRLRQVVIGNLERLCEHFFPEGIRHGEYWRVPTGARAKYLTITLIGQYRGTCWQGGKLRDFIARLQLKRGGGFLDVVSAIESALGVSLRLPSSTQNRNE